MSDHTIGSIAPIVAVTQGAVMIEKHFIIDRSLGGPDATFSMDIHEFAQMVKDVRMAEAAIGNTTYNLTEKQKAGRCFSRSLYVSKDVEKGDIVTEENIKSIRPGYGLHPKYLKMCLGKQFNRNIEKGTRLKLNDLE